MPNFHFDPTRRRAAAIPAGPAPTIKTSKSGSDRKPAKAGADTTDAKAAMALRRESPPAGDAALIAPPTSLRRGETLRSFGTTTEDSENRIRCGARSFGGA
jgi:hypothetical protein